MGTLIAFGIGVALIFILALVVNYRRQRRTSQTHLPSSVAGLDHPAYKPPTDATVAMFGGGGSDGGV